MDSIIFLLLGPIAFAWSSVVLAELWFLTDTSNKGSRLILRVTTIAIALAVFVGMLVLFSNNPDY